MQLKEFMFLYWIAVWSKSMFNPNRSWTLTYMLLTGSEFPGVLPQPQLQVFMSALTVLRSFLQGYWEGLHQFAPQFLRKSLWNKLISIHNNAAYSLLACNRFELLSLNDNMAIWPYGTHLLHLFFPESPFQLFYHYMYSYFTKMEFSFRCKFSTLCLFLVLN